MAHSLDKLERLRSSLLGSAAEMARRFPRRGAKGTSDRLVAVSTAYMVSRAIRYYASMATRSTSIRVMLNNTRLRRDAAEINLTLPHYWVRAYHDGYKGGRKRKGIWIFYPRKNGITNDPRRPADAALEKRRGQVKSFNKIMTQSRRKGLTKRLRDAGAIFTKRRKSWRGDPFFTNGVRLFNRQVDKDLTPLLGQVFDLQMERVADEAFRKFGVKVRARGVGGTLAQAKGMSPGGADAGGIQIVVSHIYEGLRGFNWKTRPRRI
jgi:hypothetical protein